MNRRAWLQSMAAAPLLAQGAKPGPVTLETRVLRINLRHTWTTTMSSSAFRDVLYVSYTRDGITGRGEGAPIVRYKEDARSAQAAVESVRDLLVSCDPGQFTKVMGKSSAASTDSGRRRRPSISR